MKNRILVVDLEATCWENEIPKNQINEIIEIGICTLDVVTGEIKDKNSYLIKPVKSEISLFCTKLTTITHELLDKEGMMFEDACNRIMNKYNSLECHWASYGKYDFTMMDTQCKTMNIQNPFGNNHINVKTLFSDVMGLTKRMGMEKALSCLNMPLVGTHHRGVDDAYNIAKILHWCLKNKK